MATPLRLLISGVMGVIAFYVVRAVVTDICANTTDWSTIEVTLVCTLIPVAVAISIILLVFYTIEKMGKD